MLGGFFATVEGFWLRQGRFFASVVVFCDGNQGFVTSAQVHSGAGHQEDIFVGDCE